MKRTAPSLPPKMMYLRDTKEKYDVRASFQRYIKQTLKIQREKGHEERLDHSPAIVTRRFKALESFLPDFLERYEEEFTDSFYISEIFTQLNTFPFGSLTTLEARQHLLLAAALWILDQVTEQDGWMAKITPFLPKDEELLDEIDIPDIWHPRYDYDLIMSVVYVLWFRYGEPELDGKNADYSRLLINTQLANGKVKASENFLGLISLIPQERIKAAVDHYTDTALSWLDHLIECLKPFTEESHDIMKEGNAAADKYNELRTQLGEVERTTEKPKKKPVINPLLVAPPVAPQPFGRGAFDFSSLALRSQLDSIPGLSKESMEKLMGDPVAHAVFEITEKMDAVNNQYDKLVEEYNDVTSQILFDIFHAGRDGLADEMEPLGDDIDPYEMCFALLMLIEMDSDFPWLCGLNVGMLTEVTNRLPWAYREYSEFEDDIWFPDEEQQSMLPASFGGPDAGPWHAPKYHEKDDTTLRSMAQILYEETGCLLPRDLEKYESIRKRIKSLGLSAKDTNTMLTMMAVLGQARRQMVTPTITSWGEPASPPPDEQEAPVNEADKTESEEIKRLRAALHDAEAAARTARKDLATLKENSAREHRELADLRSLVFSMQQEQPDEPDEPVDESKFPYEVQRETIVFGGHETWLKAIKPMLTGNVRFIDKDLIFDTGIIRHVDMIWIQTNALSHSQYGRITDTARIFKKPIRYFTNASATICAEQLMEEDSK